MGKLFWRSEEQTHSTNTPTLIRTNIYCTVINLVPADLGQKLFTTIDGILSTDGVDSTEDVSGLLGTVEKAVTLIGPQLKHNRTRLETTKTGTKNSFHRLGCQIDSSPSGLPRRTVTHCNFYEFDAV